ncbi:unnamed protein product, partial [marine sediment metagenome]
MPRFLRDQSRLAAGVQSNDTDERGNATMKALIPLAGQGTRLLPHTAKRQKALLPVGGKAVLDHILEPLIAAGITEVSLVIGHQGDQIRGHMAKYSNLRVTFVEQPLQQGLGEAVFLALVEEAEPVTVV